VHEPEFRSPDTVLGSDAPAQTDRQAQHDLVDIPCDVFPDVEDVAVNVSIEKVAEEVYLRITRHSAHRSENFVGEGLK